MGIVIRQGFKGTIVNYAGVIIGAFNLLYLFPKFLSPEVIGLTRVLIDISFMLAGIAQLGTTGIVDKFYPFFKNEEKKHSGFLVLILIYPLAGFALICTLFLFMKDYWIFLFQTKSILLLDFYYYLIPFVFFTMYLSILESYCRAHLRIAIPIFFKEIYLRIFFSLIVILYFYGYIHLQVLIALLILSYGTAVVILLGYLKYLKKLYLTSFSMRKNKEYFKQIVQFSLITFSSGALSLVASKIDVIMLSSNKGLRTTGIYAIAFYIGTIIEIPRRSISQICIPIISGFWKSQDMKGISDLYARVALNQFIIGFFILLLVWCNVDAIFDLIPNSEQYREGKYVILLIALSRLTDMLTGINSEIINTSPYYKINFFLTIVSGLVAISCNYILIPLYGINGAAVSTLIGFTIFNYFKIYYIWSKTRIQPFTIRTVQVLLAGTLTYLMVYLLNHYLLNFKQPILTIALNSFLISVLFITIIYAFRISEDMVIVFDKYILRKIKS